ncbi:MAG: YtxH domain-containing protein [Pricia sp.]
MKNNGNIGLALITGAALGAAVSILFAPAKGIDTRKKISKSAEETTDALKRAGEKLKKTTKEKYYEGKNSLESSLNAITSQAGQNADEYLPLLERKLEELKKKGRTLNKKKVKVS